MSRKAAAVSLRVVACGVGAGLAALVVAADGPPPAARRVIVDPQVTTAGGHACRACGSGQCGLHGHGGHRHHPECRDGMCVPFCPVRPSTFGFYGTQWRRWPGQGVVPASAEDAVTPMPPPKSAVPGADEESPMRPDEGGEGLEPQRDAGAEDRADVRDDDVVPDAEVPAEQMPPTTPRSPEGAKADGKPAVEEQPRATPAEPEATKPAAPPQRLPSLEDILGGGNAEPAPGGETLPRDAEDATAPRDAMPEDVFGEDAPPTATPPEADADPDPAPGGPDAGNPFEDASAAPSDTGVTLAGFRYPTAVGGSLEPGGRPWQLAPQPAKRQRAAGSPRGR